MERYAGASREQVLAVKLKRVKPPTGETWGDMASYKGHTSLKSVSLNAARSYLRAVGKKLGWKPETGKGFGKTGVSVNPGGPGVSGEAMAIFWHPDPAKGGIYIMVSPDQLDHLGILYRHVTQKNKYGGGTNRWARVTTDSDDLAALVEREVESAARTMSKQAAMRSKWPADERKLATAKVAEVILQVLLKAKAEMEQKYRRYTLNGREIVIDVPRVLTARRTENMHATQLLSLSLPQSPAGDLTVYYVESSDGRPYFLAQRTEGQPRTGSHPNLDAFLKTLRPMVKAMLEDI